MFFLVAPSSALALVLVVLAFPVVAAPANPQPPTLHSSVPEHLPPPPRTQTRPVRVVEPERAASSRAAADPAEEKVNINTADVKTLMTLPGVNRKAAQSIVAYRDTHGPFKRASDIRKVDGVGDNVWEKNRKRITTK